MAKKDDKELELALRKVEKLLVKTKKKIGRFDLDYTVQASINSTKPKAVAYAAQLTPPSPNLAPITFISHTGTEDLMKQVSAFLEDVDQDKVEIAYHEAQIVACNNTIKAHQDMIEKVKNKKQEGDESNETGGEQSNEQPEQPTKEQ